MKSQYGKKPSEPRRNDCLVFAADLRQKKIALHCFPLLDLFGNTANIIYIYFHNALKIFCFYCIGGMIEKIFLNTAVVLH